MDQRPNGNCKKKKQEEASQVTGTSRKGFVKWIPIVNRKLRDLTNKVAEIEKLQHRKAGTSHGEKNAYWGRENLPSYSSDKGLIILNTWWTPKINKQRNQASQQNGTHWAASLKKRMNEW